MLNNGKQTNLQKYVWLHWFSASPSALLTVTSAPASSSIYCIYFCTAMIYSLSSSATAMGEMCAQYIADNAAGKGTKVTTMQGTLGTATADDRAEGFNAGVQANGLDNIRDNPCDWSSETAMAAIYQYAIVDFAVSVDSPVYRDDFYACIIACLDRRSHSVAERCADDGF